LEARSIGTGSAMKAAVLGSPVSHSLSPALHRAAYHALGLHQWSYEAIECTEDELPGLLDGLDAGWAGLSLTMPLKRAVLPLLDVADPLAVAVGGANTVVFRGGRRHGFNTDTPGMVAALAHAGVNATAETAVVSALIIGAGATACSALAALREIGIWQADVAARDPRRSGELLAAARRLGMSIRLHDLPSQAATGQEITLERSRPATPPPQIRTGGSGTRLVISTIPPRAADSLVPWLCGGPSPPDVVFDVAYDPWPTRLMEAARAAGCGVVGGFEFLVRQAGRQVELMTGRQAPLGAMRLAGLGELSPGAHRGS
jgi:shikimate dehydrogenase